MIEPGVVLEFPTERMEFLATPEMTGDRYRVRFTAPPGGGPGVKGDGPHTHPGLVEIFRCVSGEMTVRLGKDFSLLSPGEVIEVPAGVVHGFLNPGSGPLVVDIDIVFTPPGPRPEADLPVFGLILDGLIRDGHVSRRTGLPPITQIALLLRDRFPEGMAQPGLGGLLMRPLAAVGRWRGYRTDFPEYEGTDAQGQ